MNVALDRPFRELLLEGEQALRLGRTVRCLNAKQIIRLVCFIVPKLTEINQLVARVVKANLYLESCSIPELSNSRLMGVCIKDLLTRKYIKDLPKRNYIKDLPKRNYINE